MKGETITDSAFYNMQATIEQPFVPYEASFVPFESELLPWLTFTFTLSNTTPQNVDNCGTNFIKLCNGAALDETTAAEFQWQFCKNIYIIKDTDVSTDFALTLITNTDNVVIAIKVEIQSQYVDIVNDFKLYGTIGGQKVLLARGRIYVPNLSVI